MPKAIFRIFAIFLAVVFPIPAATSPAVLAAGKKAGTRSKKKARKKGPTPAKYLFGHKKDAAPMPPRAIGFYSRGCLAGAEQLPPTGPAWQAMRLKRNRNWAHPITIKLIKRLAVEAKLHDGWNGLLVGDLTQPRGGPMLTGHASHQIGLDADIWLREMPKRLLNRKQRDVFQPISMLKNSLEVDPKRFTDKHIALIRRTASYPEVQRIGVNHAIKRALCQRVKGDRSWLAKIRPWRGHHYHMHIRLRCPPGNTLCRGQKSPGKGDGCAYLEKWHRNLKAWLALPKSVRRKAAQRAAKKRKKRKRRPPITLAGLPAACKTVLAAKAKPTRLVTRHDNGLNEARAIMRPAKQ